MENAKKKRSSLLGLALFLSILIGFVGCKKALDGEGSSPNFDEGEVVFDESSANALRIDKSGNNTAYPLIKLGNENLSEFKSVDSSFGYYYLAVGELDAPAVWGGSLKSTCIEIEGDKAYIGYHIPGATYGGAIDVVDVSDPEDPQLLQTVLFADMDILSIKIDGLKIYAAGARDTEVLTHLSSAAAIAVTNLSLGGTLLHPIQYAEVPGNVATSVDHTAALIYATTGNNDGGVVMVNKSNLQLVAQIDQENAKGLTFDPWALGFYVLHTDGADDSYANANVDFYPLGVPNAAFGFSFPNAIQHEAGANIVFNPFNALLLIANGYSGLNMYSPGGSLVDFVLPPASIPGINGADIYTNAVAWDGEMAYAANGGAGLQVAQNYGGLLAAYGSVELGSSANDVAASGGSIFIATAEGLKIFSLEKIDFSPFPPPIPIPAPITTDRKQLANVNFGAYRTGEHEAHHFKGETHLAALDVNSNSHFSFDGNLDVDGMATVRGAVLESNGETHFRESLAINSKGNLIVNGKVIVDGDFYFNGQVIFQEPGSSLTVNGRIFKGPTARVVNPENNGGNAL